MIWNEYRKDEVGRKIHLQLKGVPALDAINERLRRIEDALGTRRGPWRYKVKRGTPTGPIPAPASEEKKEAGDVPVASAEAARAGPEFSESPATAAE